MSDRSSSHCCQCIFGLSSYYVSMVCVGFLLVRSSSFVWSMCLRSSSYFESMCCVGFCRSGRLHILGLCLLGCQNQLSPCHLSIVTCISLYCLCVQLMDSICTLVIIFFPKGRVKNVPVSCCTPLKERWVGI